MKKIMVVDNDTLSRESILSYITQIDSGTSIYECNCFTDIKAPAMTNATVDIIIVKLLEIADKNFSALKKLTNHFCKAKLVILTQLKSISRIKQQLCIKSACIIAIDVPRIRIFNSIKYLLSTTVASQKSTQGILELSSTDCDHAISNRYVKSSGHTQHKLTVRQSQVINFIVKGFSNKQIAYELGISEGTIKLHVSSILRALKVTNRTQAANMYITSGHAQGSRHFV